MSLFTSAQEKQILAIIKRVEMNASNNYKDAAQANFKELTEKYNIISLILKK